MQISKEPKFIVAGIPRSGTTYVHRAISFAFSKKYPAKNVHKTHGLAPPDNSRDRNWEKTLSFIQEGARVLFLFGNPILSVLSTKRSVNEGYHFGNCGYFGNTKRANIYEKDWLGYEKMFDSWMQPHEFPVLSLRYETLINHLNLIDSFVGKHIKWLPFCQRRTQYTDVSKKQLATIKDVYSNLSSKIDTAPDAKLWWSNI